MRNTLFLFALAFFIPVSSQASIIFTLEGASGSSDFTMTASGSFAHANLAASTNNHGEWFRVLRTDERRWYTPTGSPWSGGIFNTFPALYVTPGTSGTIAFDITGDVTSTHTFNDLLKTDQLWLPFDQSNTLDWPSVGGTDSIMIFASGSINFTSNITYDDLNPGTYTLNLPMQDGVQFVVQTRTAATVPEPSTLALATLGLLSLAFFVFVGAVTRRQSRA